VFQIELAIAQLVGLHMYKELMWGSSLQTLSGLAEGCPAGRIADLFPEEVRGGNMAVGKRLASMLLTVVSVSSLLLVAITVTFVVSDLPYVSSLATGQDSWPQTGNYVSRHSKCRDAHVCQPGPVSRVYEDDG
jgi:hypothetical protein